MRELEKSFHSALAAHQSGFLPKAEQLYEQVLQRDRKHFPALVMLSAIKAQKADYEAAGQLIRRALKLKPDDVRALMQHAQILLAQERHDQAFAAFGEVLARYPAMPEAHVNRGAILMLRKRYIEALESFEAALAIRPDFASALCNRANALQELNRMSEALSDYDLALGLQAANPEFLASRANCLYRMHRYKEALADLNAALAFQPTNPEFLYNKANVLSQLRMLDEAFENYDKAFRIQPSLDYVAGDRLFAKLSLCDWSNLDAETATLVGAVEEGRAVARPFSMLPIPTSMALQVRCAKLFMDREFPAQPAIWKGEAYRHERIRIAYLSADFREHPVGYLIAGVLEQHDRTHFEVSAYSFGSSEPTPMRLRLEAAVEHFHDVAGMSDREVASLIRDHEIDVVVDLMGPTRNARPGILAHRAAPAQVLYLGYAGSSGARFIDYVLADAIVVPPAQRMLYPEKIIDLPDCFMATDSERPIDPETPTRVAEGLPARGFVFCAFNNSYKISRAIFDVWMELLRACPDSVLWLTSAAHRVQENLKRAAAERNVSPERVVFAVRHESNAVHLSRYRHADLFLDTTPYGAHSTACEALWVGVPVLTFCGETFASRIGASLLRCLGLSELICESLLAYKTTALRLAANPDQLIALKEKVEQGRQTSPLFNTARFTRALEDQYREIVK